MKRADCSASRSTLAAALAAVKFGHTPPVRFDAEPGPQLELGHVLIDHHEARHSKLALKLERPSQYLCPQASSRPSEAARMMLI